MSEELGLSAELFNAKRPDYINELIMKDKQYMVLASAAYCDESAAKAQNENLVNQWFEYPRDTKELRDDDCLPKLKEIIE